MGGAEYKGWGQVGGAEYKGLGQVGGAEYKGWGQVGGAEYKGWGQVGGAEYKGSFFSPFLSVPKIMCTSCRSSPRLPQAEQYSCTPRGE
ncbi:hypothetical protein ACOMHN_006666 [Nucella lapillus]